MLLMLLNVMMLTVSPMSIEHVEQIDQLYSQLCSVLKCASDDSFPICKIHSHHDYIVPGINGLAKQLHSEARADYLLWKVSGKPRAGLLYLHMCQSRIRFKRNVKIYKKFRNEVLSNQRRAVKNCYHEQFEIRVSKYQKWMGTYKLSHRTRR